MIGEILKSNFTRTTGVYFIGQIVQNGTSFLLIPVVTKHLSPEQFGIAATCFAISAVFNIVFFCCINESLYFKFLRKDDDSGAATSTVLFFLCFLIVVGTVLAFSLLSLFPNYVIFNIPYYPYIFYTILYSLFSVITLSYYLILQACGKILVYVFLSFGVFLFHTGIMLLLLVHYKLGAMSYIFSYLVVFVVSGFSIVIALFKKYGISFRYEILAGSLKFSLPLVPHNLAHWFRDGIDKVFLSSLVSLSSTGIYNIAFSISRVVAFAVEGFRMNNNPRFFELIKDKERNEPGIVSMLPISVGLFSVAACFLSMFSKEAVDWFIDERYFLSYKYIPILASSFLWFLIYLNIVNVLFVLSLTKIVSLVTMASSLIFIPASYAMITYFEIYGAAFSLLFANVVTVLLVYRSCQKYACLRWPIGKSMAIASLPVLICFVVDEALYVKLPAVILLSFIIIGMIYIDFRRIRMKNEL